MLGLLCLALYLPQDCLASSKQSIGLLPFNKALQHIRRETFRDSYKNDRVKKGAPHQDKAKYRPTLLVSLSLSKAIVCCLRCKPPRTCFIQEKSACLLNILWRETLKTVLLACNGRVRMDKPICRQWDSSNYLKETMSSFTAKTEIDE